MAVRRERRATLARWNTYGGRLLTCPATATDGSGVSCAVSEGAKVHLQSMPNGSIVSSGFMACLLQRRTKPARPEHRHDGKVAVPNSNQSWCSNGFEFKCENGEPLRVTFALYCCDREAMSWAATTGGYNGEVVRDV